MPPGAKPRRGGRHAARPRGRYGRRATSRVRQWAPERVARAAGGGGPGRREGWRGRVCSGETAAWRGEVAHAGGGHARNAARRARVCVLEGRVLGDGSRKPTPVHSTPSTPRTISTTPLSRCPAAIAAPAIEKTRAGPPDRPTSHTLAIWPPDPDGARAPLPTALALAAPFQAHARTPHPPHSHE